MTGKLKIVVSKTKSSDIESILIIEKECGLSLWTEDGHLEELKRKDAIGLAARSADEVMGFLNARIVGDSEMDILNFGVAKEHQGKGIGAKLWSRLLKRSVDYNCQAFWLEVRESNVNAISFYKKRGFIEVQTRKKFYSSPTENALLMKLEVVNYDPKILFKT